MSAREEIAPATQQDPGLGPDPIARRATRFGGGARRAIGAVIVLTYLPVYVALAATLGGALAAAPPWAALAFYAAAGFAWVAPLYPLFVWMGGPARARPHGRAGAG